MIPGLTGAALALLLVCVAAEIGRELSFKGASLVADRNGYSRTLAAQPLLWCGLALWTVETAAWLLALQHTRLGVAFPIITLSYGGVPLAAAWLLGEPISRRQMLGAALVAAGVLSISLSELRWASA